MKILLFLCAMMMASCSERKADSDNWRDRYLNYSKYDYTQQYDVIIDACNHNIIKLGDDKDKIRQTFGIPDQEHVQLITGTIVYSDAVYSQFWFEFDENNKVVNGYLTQEEGANASGFQGYSLK